MQRSRRRATRGGRRKPARGQGGADAVGAYASDAWSLAKRTALGLNEIRKLINVEQKFKETSGNPTYDSNGTISYLSGVDQGDSTITREGNSIKVQKFRLRFFLKHNTSVTTATKHRILVVRDLQNQGATITANDVLETVGTSNAPNAFIDFTNGPLQNKRFAVVYDRSFVTDPYHLGRMEDDVNAHDVHVYFRGTDATVASAGNGAYFLVAVCSDSGANLPTLIYNTRFEFTDN